MAIDIANAVRSLAATRNLKVEVHGFFVCTCFANNNSSPLVAANTYSLLEELNHATARGNESAGEKKSHAQLFESRDAPFDYVYLVPIHTGKADENTVDVLDVAARYLALDKVPDVRAMLRTCRATRTQREEASDRSLTIKKVGHGLLVDQKRRFIRSLAEDLAGAVLQHWLAKDTTANWEQVFREEQLAAIMPKDGQRDEWKFKSPDRCGADQRGDCAIASSTIQGTNVAGVYH